MTAPPDRRGGHAPEEWGSPKRLTCSCGHPDPGHMDKARADVAAMLTDCAHEYRQEDRNAGMFSHVDAAEICETLAAQLATPPASPVQGARVSLFGVLVEKAALGGVADAVVGACEAQEKGAGFSELALAEIRRLRALIEAPPPAADEGQAVADDSPDVIGTDLSDVPKSFAAKFWCLGEAMALVAFFGGNNASVCVVELPAGTIHGDEGEPLPEGKYAWCSDYPEEGATYLGEHDPDTDKHDDRPPASPVSVAATPVNVQESIARMDKMIGRYPDALAPAFRSDYDTLRNWLRGDDQ